MKKYFAILFILTISACELVVDVDMPIEKSKVVLNAFFTPDSVWKAKVSLNRHILDDSGYPPIPNAEIIVFEGDTPLDTLHYDTLGYYFSNDGGPKIGKTYSMRAIVPDYEIVEASSSCPIPVTPTFSALQTGVAEFNQPVYSFDITFTDPPGRNFYQITAVSETRFTHPQTGQGFVNYNFIQTWSDDQAIDNEDIPNNEGFFFSDVLFNEEEFTVNVKMMPNGWGGPPTKTKFHVYFRAVSEDYYRYKVTSLLQDFVGEDPFAQPAQVYNNIQNGFGIFAGYSQSVITFEK